MGNFLSKAGEQYETKAKRSVCLPPETWVQVFAWIARMELARTTSFVSRRFHRIAHIRMHEKCVLFPENINNTRKMRSLKISNKKDALKLPECPPPDNIVGIHVITICYIDVIVLAFFKHIRPLLTDLELHINIGSLQFAKLPWLRSTRIDAIERLLPLCKGPNSTFNAWLEDFGELSAKCPQYLAKCKYFILFVQSKKCLAAIPKLAKWLSEPKEDGQAKRMRFFDGFGAGKLLIEQIKENFYLDTIPSQFYICVHFSENFGTFRVQNARTGEQLSMEMVENPDGLDHGVLITRCASQKADQNFKKAKQKMFGGGSYLGTGLLCFYDDPIWEQPMPTTVSMANVAAKIRQKQYECPPYSMIWRWA